DRSGCHLSGPVLPLPLYPGDRTDYQRNGHCQYPAVAAAEIRPGSSCHPGFAALPPGTVSGKAGILRVLHPGVEPHRVRDGEHGRDYRLQKHPPVRQNEKHDDARPPGWNCGFPAERRADPDHG
ncbi:Lactoylglutathione lyase, partial [Dysosmobacter welbionis]